MKKVYIYTLVAVLFLAACADGGNTNKRPKSIANGPQYVGDSLGNGVRYVYKNYILVSEIPMTEQMAHGVCKEFYDDGKIKLELNYNMGMRDGMQTEFYETGEKYVETPFTDNKIDGTKYRYKKDGTVVFEVPYKKGLPVPGIKEYDGSGNLVEQPSIKFTRKGGTLEIKLSDDNASAEFYQVTEGELLKVPSEKGIGKLTLGNAKKGDLTIRASYKTAYGNKAAIDATY